LPKYGKLLKSFIRAFYMRPCMVKSP